MNNYMQQQLTNYLKSLHNHGLKTQEEYTLEAGFETCHDLLLPLLKEALAELCEISMNDDLVRRIKQVVED